MDQYFVLHPFRQGGFVVSFIILFLFLFFFSLRGRNDKEPFQGRPLRVLMLGKLWTCAKHLFYIDRAILRLRANELASKNYWHLRRFKHILFGCIMFY